MVTAPDGRPQGADTPTVVEMTPAEDAWYWWEHAQSGVDTPGCDCGHDGMGPAWHTADCRGAATAYRRKARELHGALAASGGTASPTDDELLRIACVARNDGHEQHAVARWGEELAPVVTALHATLAARTPQPLPSDEDIARAFHAAYERLAPDHGYETRAATARPWADVPAQNRALMVATVHEVREWLAGQPSLADLDAAARTPQPDPDDRCDECDECGDPRSDHDDGTAACRRLLRPLWDPDDVCWCGRFVEPAPDSEETP